MRTIPFGYRIEEGIVVIDEKDGEDVRKIYQLYLEEVPLTGISPRLGLKIYHQNISHILENPIYVGTDFYPGIVEQSVFDEVQRIRERSKRKYAKRPSSKSPPQPILLFKISPVKKQFSDPFEQAQHVYKLITPKE